MVIFKRKKEEKFEPNAPSFHSTGRGYDMREVDEYIDRIRLEQEQIYRQWQEDVTNWVRLCEKMTPKTSVSYPYVANFFEEDEEEAKPSRVKTLASTIVFYVTLVVVVVGAFIVAGSGSNGVPQNVMGFSTMTVLTRSMQDVIPQHSLIITRRVPPESIQIGDDITYLVRGNMTVTHRVIEIHENFQNSGMRGFVTQGVMNSSPDSDVVLAANLVGRVVFHNLFLGRMVAFFRSNVLIAVGLVLMLMIFNVALKRGLQKEQYQ